MTLCDIADCTKTFILESESLSAQGDSAFLMAEIQDQSITSPPEQVFYAALSAIGITSWASIHPQFPIKNFRVDFMLSPLGYFINHPDRLYSDELLDGLQKILQNYVVEIDGFEWHDKTPRQAEYDKRRERIIQQHGYILYRFAAREVLREPIKCASEIQVLLLKQVRTACLRLTLK